MPSHYIFTAVLEYNLLSMVVKFKWYCYQTAGVKEMHAPIGKKKWGQAFKRYLHNLLAFCVFWC